MLTEDCKAVWRFSSLPSNPHGYFKFLWIFQNKIVLNLNTLRLSCWLLQQLKEFWIHEWRKMINILSAHIICPYITSETAAFLRVLCVEEQYFTHWKFLLVSFSSWNVRTTTESYCWALEIIQPIVWTWGWKKQCMMPFDSCMLEMFSSTVQQKRKDISKKYGWNWKTVFESSESVLWGH